MNREQRRQAALKKSMEQKKLMMKFNKNSLDLNNIINKDRMSSDFKKQAKRNKRFRTKSSQKTIFSDSLRTFVDSNLTIGGPMKQDPEAYSKILQKKLDERNGMNLKIAG